MGQEPRHILITPDKQYALVLNRKSGDMAVIRIYSLTSQDSMRRYRYPTPLFTMIPVGGQPVDAAMVALRIDRSHFRAAGHDCLRHKNSYFFLPWVATESMAVFTFSDRRDSSGSGA